MKIRIFFLIIFALCPSAFSAEPFKPYRGFITNVEDDDAPITVFKTPGQNWRYCKKDQNNLKDGCTETVGWPGRDAKITVLSSPVTAQARDFQTGKSYNEEYVEIEFEYTRKGADGKMYHQKGTGFIESEYIEKKETKSFYTAQNTKDLAPCAVKKSDPQSKIKEISNSLKDLAGSITNLSLEKKADALANIVGFCPLKPPTKPPGPFDKNKNVYDQAILPTLLKSKVPPIRNEDNKLMSRDEMIQIDTLARTLYGEMAICYRRGLQYPMAVAKIIMNRTENEDRKSEFIAGPHSDKAPPLTQICTSPTQFSMWLKKINSKANETLHHGLCPPLKPNEPFWGSDQASKFEADIWKNTMRIATEAILYPKKFKERTKEVDGYFYTSGVGKFYKMTRHIPSIEGKKIDRPACLEIWKEKK
ncbi:MAG: hypothetical protein H7256_06175 [Bdellovibrio sp.]|nr:hypothetical protein [Bdellovibrio sp.]